MKIFHHSLLYLTLAFNSAGVFAQEPPSTIFAPQKTPPPKLEAHRELNSLQEMTIEAGMAEIIRLPEPVSNIFLVDQGIADIQLQTPETLYLYGHKPGRTTLFATTKTSKQVLNLRLHVVNNVDTLREVIRSIAPDSDVTVSSLGGSLILKGRVTSLKVAQDIQAAASRFTDAKSVINQIQVQAPVQVNLRVKIAEVNRNVTRNLGINWENITKPGSLAIGLASSHFVDLTSSSTSLGFTSSLSSGTSSSSSSSGSSSSGGSASSSPAGKLFQITSSGNPNILLSYKNGDRANLNALIDAVASEGLGVILSEPNLTALSGQAATFTAGGEVPVTIPGTANNPATVQYKEYGVKLSFTPTVLSDNLIQIQVSPEVSSITNVGQVQGNPGFLKRSATTVVQLNSGQSFAIAGLIQNSGNSSISAIPGLGDLPGFLGALFRSTQFSRSETELVMIVTPYIVKPSSSPLTTPLDTIQEASHLERILLGKLAHSKKPSDAQKSPTKTASEKRPRLVGQAGFLIE